ncbi:MAG: hypothetical protein ACE5FG_03280 [Myxococcota bacterium]
MDPGELCDDGNKADADGCAHDCSIEICGDVNGDSRPDLDDVAALRVFLADPVGSPLSSSGTMRCSVIGGPDDCDMANVVVMRRSLSSPPLPPGWSQICPAASP